MNDIGIKIGLQGLSFYNAQLSDTEKKTKSWASRMGKSIRGIASNIPIIGSSLSQLLTPAGAVAGAFGLIAQQAVSATKTAAAFQQQITQVGALAGLEKTSDQFKALEAEAKRLGSTTEFSANQSAKAMEFLTRAGFTAQQTLEGTAGTLALATVGNLDLGKAADIATDTLSQFGLQAKDLGSVVDIIAKTTVTANTNVTQFSDAMNYLGATANALGVSLPESSAVIGILSSAGLKGSLATRAFGTSLLRLTKPSREAADLIKELNINAFDTQGNFIGIAGLIENLEQSFTGLSQKQKQQAIATIFGAEAVQEFNILLEKGSGELRKYTGEIEGAAAQNGKFSEGIRTQFLDTFNGAIKNLSSAFEGLQIALVDGGLDPLSSFVNGLADGLRYLTRFAEGAITLQQILYDNAEVLGLAATAMGYFITSFAVGKIVALGAAIQAAGGAMAFFNVTLTANPIGVVVVAVGLLVTAFIALYKRSQPVRATIAGLGALFTELGNIIKNGFLKVIEGLGTSLDGLFNLDFAQVKSGIKTAIDGVLDSNILTTAFKNGERLANAFSNGYQDKIIEEINEATKKSLSDESGELQKAATDGGAKAGAAFGQSFTQKAIENINLSGVSGNTTPTIQGPGLNSTDTAISTPDNAEQTNAALLSLGLNLDFINDKFSSTNEILAAMEGIGFRVADSLGMSTQKALEFQLGLQDLGATIKQTIATGAANAFQTFGKEIGKAITQGQGFGNAMQALFKGLVNTILVEVPKLIGVFLLQTGVGLGFPAGLPFVVAGIALTAFSGIASGLLSNARGGQGQNVATPTQDNISGNFSQNSINQANGASLGLSNQFQQQSATNTIYIYMDSEEISNRVTTNIETNNLLQGQPIGGN